MIAIENIGTALLSLVLGISAPLYAQEHAEKQDHGQPAKHEQSKPAPQHAQARQENKQPQHAQKQESNQRDQSKPSAQHTQPRAQQHAQQKPAPEKQHSTQHAEKSQPERREQHAHAQPSQHAEQRGHESSRRTPEQQRMQHTAWHEHGSQHWESEHRTWQQRGGYHGYRIPEDRFRGHFGRDHGFRISGLPFLVVGGFPRFQYQGYWFSEVDPWPESWGDDWYDNDDVYVSYVDNGYYLYNRRYPGMGIAINISR